MGKASRVKRIKEPEDKLADAKRQGQAQYDSIKEMVEALNPERDGMGARIDGLGDDADDEARQTIHDDALSVQVRSGWYSPGASREDTVPEEYEILLCTGGPACRIIGQLDRGSPTTARMQVQDWFQPWIDFHPEPRGSSEAVMLEYASVFYFED